jgi:hypothetical protein
VVYNFRVIVMFGAYFCLGTLYRRKVMFVEGVDALPNVEFWREFPFLVQVMYCLIYRKV